MRQMADQAAHVRRIAIEKRKVTPRLAGGGVRRRGQARATPPQSFAPFLKRRSIEGFLFPAGYEFLPSSSAASLVARQIATFRAALADSRPARREGAQADAVRRAHDRLARRARGGRRRPSGRSISAVIHNRLDRGMPLAIDASLRYGLGVEGTRSLTEKHLRSGTPYNTHRFRGLPPTPITNPGLPSMRAAAKPARVDYLFYVRKPNSFAPLLHRERRGVLREGGRVRLRGLLSAVSAAPRRGAARRHPPSRGRCARPRRPSRAGRRPGRPPRA